jgi:hypothetical protein
VRDAAAAAAMIIPNTFPRALKNDAPRWLARLWWTSKRLEGSYVSRVGSRSPSRRFSGCGRLF